MKSLSAYFCQYRDLWTCGPVDLWTEDIHLYEVVWTCGPVGLWTCGPVDLWTCGSEDLWTEDIEDIHLYYVVWTCGPARHKYVRRHAICMQLFVLKK